MLQKIIIQDFHLEKKAIEEHVFSEVIEMLKDNLSVDKIAKYTSLSVEQVQAIAKQHAWSIASVHLCSTCAGCSSKFSSILSMRWSYSTNLYASENNRSHSPTAMWPFCCSCSLFVLTSTVWQIRYKKWLTVNAFILWFNKAVAGSLRINDYIRCMHHG